MAGAAFQSVSPNHLHTATHHNATTSAVNMLDLVLYCMELLASMAAEGS
jgi:hypothetical protein